MQTKKSKMLHCYKTESLKPVRYGQGHFSSERLHPDMVAECLKKLPGWWTVSIYCTKYVQYVTGLCLHQREINWGRSEVNIKGIALYCLLSLCILCCYNIRLLGFKTLICVFALQLLLLWRVIQNMLLVHFSSPATSPPPLSDGNKLQALFPTFHVAINGCILKRGAWAIQYTVNFSDVDLPLRNRVTDWYLSELCWWALRTSSALTWISATSCLSVSQRHICKHADYNNAQFSINLFYPVTNSDVSGDAWHLGIPRTSQHSKLHILFQWGAADHAAEVVSHSSWLCGSRCMDTNVVKP